MRAPHVTARIAGFRKCKTDWTMPLVIITGITLTNSGRLSSVHVPVYFFHHQHHILSDQGKHKCILILSNNSPPSVIRLKQAGMWRTTVKRYHIHTATTCNALVLA